MGLFAKVMSQSEEEEFRDNPRTYLFTNHLVAIFLFTLSFVVANQWNHVLRKVIDSMFNLKGKRSILIELVLAATYTLIFIGLTRFVFKIPVASIFFGA